MSGLSSATRTLLKAAKTDAPQRVARAKIWMGVAGTTGVGAAGVAAAAGSASLAPAATGATAATGAAGALSAGKLLAIGALLGSSVTVGLAVAVLRVAPLSGAPKVLSAGWADPPAMTDQAPPVPMDLPDPAVVPVTLAAAARSPARTPANTPASATANRTGARPVVEDQLMREATLVAEARGSLVRGDAAGALAAAQAAGRVGSGALEPEELSVEAHSLRALGREQEALSAEARLKALFPEHALSR